MEIVARSEDWHRLKAELNTDGGAPAGTDAFQGGSGTNTTTGATRGTGTAQALTAADREREEQLRSLSSLSLHCLEYHQTAGFGFVNKSMFNPTSYAAEQGAVGAKT